ncbi:hypothetical protein CIRG_03753 [Coccidioides immitis RMSCC 2394]|uniref:Uncharacterized protein n=1 Tax=Coccidioides immitis RMSCC 2394 TaxID=404692 RepID=A0A0J7B2Q1_COCIT|nr:hypothetical protein CIRG_03753 [Coccidioides immitis RMSCC 2394]
MDIDTQHPVIVGDMASMTPPASADGEKPSPRADSPRGSDMDVDSGASVDDDEIRPDHYYGGGRIPIFKPLSDHHSIIHSLARECFLPNADNFDVVDSLRRLLL